MTRLLVIVCIAIGLFRPVGADVFAAQTRQDHVLEPDGYRGCICCGDSCDEKGSSVMAIYCEFLGWTLIILALIAAAAGPFNMLWFADWIDKVTDRWRK